MEAATIIEIITALSQLAADEPVIVNGARTVCDLIRSGNAPSDAEQAQIDALLDAAHARLQGTTLTPQPATSAGTPEAPPPAGSTSTATS